MVEDDAVMRRFYVRILVRAGHRVDTAGDGAAGWEAIQANHYDLLITDHEMPKVTGLELVKKLRAARLSLLVILASGAMPTEELDRNPWLQLAAALEKPFTGRELLESVEKVLSAQTKRVDGRVAATLAEPVACG
jgi:DNA-binding response OmpR family regulator